MFNKYYYDLSIEQWDALQNLSRVSKMDCWFYLDHDELGDFVLDAEDHFRRMAFLDAIGQLFEGITDWDLERLSQEDRDALNILSIDLFDETL